MKTASFLFALLAIAVAAPALGQGKIGTLSRGTYACELPGDAAGAIGLAQPDASLTIKSASRYDSPQGSGTYLRRGDRVTLTSGPRRGESYAVISERFLRRIEAGEPGPLRCILGRS